MAGRDKDIDPASELVEDDEEQALPDSEELELDIVEATGPIGAGRAALLRHAKLAPSAPGVYRMLDAAGEVLYVGKAKNIKKRITSYTRPTGHDTRIERVIAATAAVEFVTTATETEALLLEANLIKRLRPRFNVLLRDDKSFPYIIITSDHWAPQILKHRGARSRQGSYYGPFASVWAVNRTITALQRAFLLRSCSDGFFESRTRPCLLHQIKRCSAPCTQEIDFAEYAELVREANAFLSGKSQAVRDELSGEMEKASVALDFERAAIYRDRLAALSATQSTQGINPRSTEEADVFAIHQDGGYSGIEVFFFRTGQNWGNRAYFPKADRTLGPGEVLGAFLAQFYDDKPCPSVILLSHDIPERELLAEALSTKTGRRVEVSVPQRGEKKELVAHALVNAREALGRKLADTSSQQRLLKALADTFGLPRVPRRIEVYDNSHIQGSNAVGAMIVAGQSGFQKNQYRKFNIRSAELTPGDDFGMMREVLERRFKRLIAETPRAGAGRGRCGHGAARHCAGGKRRRRERLAVARSGADRRRAGPAQCRARDAGRGRRDRRADDRRRQGAGPRCRQRDLLFDRQAGGETAAARSAALFHSKAARRSAPVRHRVAPHPPEEGHPRSGLAGNSRHRPDAKARAAAPFRHLESDRARFARRSGAGAGHQRRDRPQDPRFLPRNGKPVIPHLDAAAITRSNGAEGEGARSCSTT